jgi:hypothetical protein
VASGPGFGQIANGPDFAGQDVLASGEQSWWPLIVLN